MYMRMLDSVFGPSVFSSMSNWFSKMFSSILDRAIVRCKDVMVWLAVCS